MAESTFETFPMKESLGRWQMLIGTMTETLKLVVLKKAILVTDLDHTYRELLLISDLWVAIGIAKSRKNFKRTPSSRMTEYESEVDYWKSVVTYEEDFGFFFV